MPSRKLRNRTIQQTNPFEFDKIQHQLKSKGRTANADQVKAILSSKFESVGTPTKAKRKAAPTGNERAKRSKKTSATPKESTGSVAIEPVPHRRSASSLSFSSLIEQSRVERTTLKVWLDGFKGGSVPVPLRECRDVDQLVGSIIKAWDWQFNGRRFSYAVARFPWLDDDANIIIRHGLVDSFQNLMDEVETAPIWAEGKKARCDVKITVYVQ